eukprot:CAMPEP_0174238606 /NCGR_PEP_ID=MMETSP0417-20130205/11988_1 /TAXON_ID=242541 /ORGANISM="Mayorella sp, Strain BSH-02190019" /LENGTH=156 /DNA_ID=CAMNT_0015317467 /DNA_START=80 /DNA_END=550 /DNA_ORIENTATION=+
MHISQGFVDRIVEDDRFLIVVPDAAGGDILERLVEGHYPVDAVSHGKDIRSRVGRLRSTAHNSAVRWHDPADVEGWVVDQGTLNLAHGVGVHQESKPLEDELRLVLHSSFHLNGSAGLDGLESVELKKGPDVVLSGDSSEAGKDGLVALAGKRDEG